MDFFREHISVSVSSVLYILSLLSSNHSVNIMPVSVVHRSQVSYSNFLDILYQKVENRVSVLSDLRELASAESLDTFTLIYTNILEHQPDCPVRLCPICFK
jgi:exocyst complex component 3